MINFKGKFNIIVGNPPYVDSSKGNIPIYQEFVKKSFNLASIVSLIIPSSPSTSDERHGKEVRDIIFTRNTNRIKFLDNTVFPDANVNTLYFISRSDNDTDTEIICNGTSYFIDSNKNTFILKTEMLHSILDKCKSLNQSQSWITFNRLEGTDIPQSSKKIDTVMCITKDNILIEKINTCDRYIGHYKVVTTLLPNDKHHLNVVWPVDKGIAVKSGYTVCLVTSYKEAVNLSKYLKSNFCKFIYTMTKTSRSLRSPQLKFIPKIDLTRSWTDQEIYQHFNLTQEEIDYIEANVK